MVKPRIFSCFSLLALCSLAHAASTTVTSCSNLQTALNQAQPGDIIQIQAGLSCSGHFTVPANSGTDTIFIQSTAAGSLPALGHRVNYSDASNMAQLVTPDGNPVLSMTGGSTAYYRFFGIEFTVASNVYVQDLIQVGNGGETSYANLPHHITFDHDYIHGSNYGGKRGIAMNGGLTTIENSIVSGFYTNNQDTQAIEGWNGPGPFRIINNYLEAAGETVAFGGAPTGISGVIPSDILVAHNDIAKQPGWQTAGNPGQTCASQQGNPPYPNSYDVKNLFEVKNGQRILVDSNNFTYNWIGCDQRGYAVVLGVRTEGGSVSWATVNNVKFTNNHFNHSSSGVYILGHDRTSSYLGNVHDIAFQNNLFEDIGYGSGADGRAFQVQDGAYNINIDHNTMLQYGGYAPVLALIGNPSAVSGVNYTNNVTNNGAGLNGQDTNGNSYYGASVISSLDSGGSFVNNYIIGGSSANYPSGNYYASSISSVPSGYGANLNSPIGLPTGFITITNRNSGLCLDMPTDGATNFGQLQGQQMQQWYCTAGYPSQVMQLTPYNLTSYFIIMDENQQGLAIQYGSTNNGAPIVNYQVGTGSYQTFNISAVGSGYYTFSPLSSTGQTVDVGGASTSAGAALVEWPYFGGSNEQWSFTPIQ